MVTSFRTEAFQTKANFTIPKAMEPWNFPFAALWRPLAMSGLLACSASSQTKRGNGNACCSLGWIYPHERNTNPEGPYPPRSR